jgi:hypothetical protein
MAARTPNEYAALVSPDVKGVLVAVAHGDALTL